MSNTKTISTEGRGSAPPGRLREGEPRMDESAERRQTAGETRLFVLLEDSPASARVLQYVAQVVGTGERFHVCLLQLLPAFPPEMLEHGGSEIPAKEDILGAELQERQHVWVSDARRSAERNLQRAAAELQKAGVRAEAVDTYCCQPEEGPDTVDFVLATARERGCRTVVVGLPSAESHESFSRRLVSGVLRHGHGMSIWAVA
jgi:hypothetical protein